MSLNSPKERCNKFTLLSPGYTSVQSDLNNSLDYRTTSKSKNAVESSIKKNVPKKMKTNSND